MLLQVLVGFLTSIAAGLAVRRIETWFARTQGTEPPVDGSRSVLLTVTCAGVLFFVLYSLDQRWATSRFQGLVTFTSALVLLLVAATLRQLMGTRWLLPGVRRWALDVSFLALAFLVAFLLDGALPHEVSLRVPRMVGSNEIVTGSVADDDSQVFVVVQPAETSNAFVFRAHGPDAERTWSAFCEFGGGAGTTYLVTAYAVDPYAAPIIDNSDRPAYYLELGYHARSKNALVCKQ